MRRAWTTWLARGALVLALAPAASVGVTALAATRTKRAPPPAPSTTQLTAEDPKSKLLAAIASDPAALINVSAADMPASPDILALGKRSTLALERCLSDNDEAELRVRCARFLELVGDKHALKALQTALEDWEPSVRGAAVRTLASIPDPSSLEPLLKVLRRKDEDENNKVLAIRALGALGHKRAMSVLRTKFHETTDNGLERQAAFEALYRSRHLMSRETLVNDVKDALGESDHALVLAAIEAAADLRHARLVDALVPLLDSEDATIKNRSARALGLIGDKSATKALLAKLPDVRDGRMLNNIAFALERLDRPAFFATMRSMIEHKQAIIRLNAAFVLGDVRRPEGVPYLVRALEDASDLVRTSAVAALGKTGDAGAIQALEGLVDAPSPSLRKEVAFSIFALSSGKRAELLYEKVVRDPRVGEKARAAALLGELGDSRVRPDLLLGIDQGTYSASEVARFAKEGKDPSFAARILLAWARGHAEYTPILMELKPPGTQGIALGVLGAALASNDPAQGRAAMELAGHLGDPAPLADLRRFVSSDDHENLSIRWRALAAMADLGDEGAGDLLLARFDQLPVTQLESLANALARITSPGARAKLTPELVRRTKDPDARVALAAASTELAWAPEEGFFRFLRALDAPSTQERELAQHYLAASRDPEVTALLRRALARERRDDVRDELRALLAKRKDT